MKEYKQDNTTSRQSILGMIIAIIIIGSLLLNTVFSHIDFHDNTRGIYKINSFLLRPIATTLHNATDDFSIQSMNHRTITPNSHFVLAEQRKILDEAWKVIAEGSSGDIDRIRGMSVKDFANLIGAKPVNWIIRYVIGVKGIAFYLLFRENGYVTMPFWKRIILSYLGVNSSGIYYFKSCGPAGLMIKFLLRSGLVMKKTNMDELRSMFALNKDSLFHELCEKVLTDKRMYMSLYLDSHASQEVIISELEFAALISKRAFSNKLKLRISEINLKIFFHNNKWAEWEKAQVRQNLEELCQQEEDIEASWKAYKKVAKKRFYSMVLPLSARAADIEKKEEQTQEAKKTNTSVLSALISRLRFSNDKGMADIISVSESLYPELITIYNTVGEDYSKGKFPAAWHYRIRKATDAIGNRIKNKDVDKLLITIDKKFNKDFDPQDTIILFWNSLKAEIASRLNRDEQQLRSLLNLREDYLAHLNGELSPDLERHKFTCIWPIESSHWHVQNYHGEVDFQEKFPSFHHGIDIRVMSGAVVKNVMKGEVLGVEYKMRYEQKGVNIYIYSKEERLLWVYAHIDPYSLNKKLYNIQITGKEINSKDDNFVVLEEGEPIGKVIEWKEPVNRKRKKELSASYRYFSQRLFGYQFSQLHLEVLQNIDRPSLKDGFILYRHEDNSVNPLLLLKRLCWDGQDRLPPINVSFDTNIEKRRDIVRKAFQNSA